MRFTKTIDIWAKDRDAILPTLQAGQWVTAGPHGARGRFCGVRPSGSIVVAWCGNARNGRRREYLQSLITYANAR